MAIAMVMDGTVSEHRELIHFSRVCLTGGANVARVLKVIPSFSVSWKKKQDFFFFLKRCWRGRTDWSFKSSVLPNPHSAPPVQDLRMIC